MKPRILLLLFILMPAFSFGQNDSLVKGYKKDFETFKQSIQKEHQQFKDKNDSIFIRFLKDSWASFEVFYKTKAEPSKPVVQPSLPELPPPVQEYQKVEPGNKKINDTIPPPLIIEIKPEFRETPATKNSSGKSESDIGFYGEKITVSPTFELPVFNSIRQENISSYFEKVASLPDLPVFIASLDDQKKQLNLNDWGYLKLIVEVADKIVANKAEQILFTWAILLKSGYNVKLGFNADKVFLLVPFEQEVFNTYYIDFDGITYSILADKNVSGTIPAITVHRADYPGNRKLSLAIKELPVLGNSFTEKELVFQDRKLKVVLNKGLIDYFNEYPFCGFNVYFSCPLSESSIKSLDDFFRPVFKGTSDSEKVSILLRFLQRSFSYRTDKEQFGRERYLFPEETLFYPYSDCEDRSILFSRLVKHYTGLPCIALNFPGHVSVAIKFPGELKGDKIRFNDSDYMVCDPTYLNAGIGKLPPDYADSKYKIVTFE